MQPRRSSLSGEAYAPPPLAGSVSRRASASDLDTPSGGRGVLRHIYTSQGVIEYESVLQEEGDQPVEEVESVGPVEANSQAPLVGGGTLHHSYTRSREAIPSMSEDASPAISPEEMAEALAVLGARLPPAFAVQSGLVGGRGRSNSSTPSFSAPPARVRRRASFAHIGQRALPTISEEEDFSVTRRFPLVLSPPRRRQSTLAPVGTPRASSSPSPQPLPLPQPLPQPLSLPPIGTSSAPRSRRAETMSTPRRGSAQLLPDSDAILDDFVPLPPGHPHANGYPFMAQTPHAVASPASYPVQHQAQLQSLPPFQNGQQQQSQPGQQGQEGATVTTNGISNSQPFTHVGPSIVSSSTTNGAPAGHPNGILRRNNTSGGTTTTTNTTAHTPIAVPARAHTQTPTRIMTGVITPNPNGGTLISDPHSAMASPPPPPPSHPATAPSPITVPPPAHTVSPSRAFDPDGPLPPGMMGNPPLMAPMMPHYAQHEEVARAHRRLERDVRNKQGGVLVDVEDGEFW